VVVVVVVVVVVTLPAEASNSLVLLELEANFLALASKAERNESVEEKPNLLAAELALFSYGPANFSPDFE